MKTIEQQKQTAKSYFNKHIENGTMTEKDWSKFYLGWLEKGYEIAYNEFEEYKNETVQSINTF